MTPCCNYICHHPIYSTISGTFESVSFGDEISSYIVSREIYKKKGDFVEECKNATHKIGTVIFCFGDQDTQLRYFDCIDKYIKIRLS